MTLLNSYLNWLKRLISPVFKPGTISDSVNKNKQLMDLKQNHLDPYLKRRREESAALDRLFEGKKD